MECRHFANLNYGEFSRRLHLALAHRRVPIEGSIDLTARCNLRCAHCYINEPYADPVAKRRELSSKIGGGFSKKWRKRDASGCA